jgi:hypothetical protein
MVRLLLRAGALVAILSPSPAHALGTESLGNRPIGAGWGFDEALLELVNSEARVYWYEVNGNPLWPRHMVSRPASDLGGTDRGRACVSVSA